MGAFNDNFFKQALLILIVFQGFGNLEMKDDKLSELALAVFTVPFFLLSATAGQIADKFDKALVIQRLKIVESPPPRLRPRNRPGAQAPHLRAADGWRGRRITVLVFIYR